jgi:uncharacterized protein
MFKRGNLEAILERLDRPVIAVSGGVDSMTLAYLAHRRNIETRMVHAVSPAVPAEATRRVARYASGQGWTLELIDAGELADPRYRANPANRCYFCKHNLYGEIAQRFAGTIASGTNTDDLGDYRPGLRAAEEHSVRHPFVEAGISKADVRAIARSLSLDDLADLPAAPCLSSRVETGIAINARTLALIDAVEVLLRGAFGGIDLRCRVVARGIRLEFEESALAAYLSPDRSELRSAVAEMVGREGHALLGAVPYRRGSAFLRG